MVLCHKYLTNWVNEEDKEEKSTDEIIKDEDVEKVEVKNEPLVAIENAVTPVDTQLDSNNNILATPKPHRIWYASFSKVRTLAIYTYHICFQGESIDLKRLVRDHVRCVYTKATFHCFIRLQVI